MRDFMWIAVGIGIGYLWKAYLDETEKHLNIESKQD